MLNYYDTVLANTFLYKFFKHSALIPELLYMSEDWLYRYKNKIIFSVFIVLALSMCGTSIITIMLLQRQLINEMNANTKQMGSSITSSLHSLMLANSPEKLQQTLSDIRTDESITTISIVSNSGRIIYSSNRDTVGGTHPLSSEESGRAKNGSQSEEADPVISNSDNSNSTINRSWFLSGGTSRSINIIRNEAACYPCHPKNESVIGKLIIDRPLEPTYSLIRSIVFIIVSSGLIGLMLVIPLISRVISQYIDQILLKKQELTLVYTIINSISKTIEIAELTRIVLDITRNMLSAEEVDIVLPKGDEFRVLTNNPEDDSIIRRKLDSNEPLHAAIERWKSGEIKGFELSADHSEIFLSIEMGKHRLGLIAARSKKTPLMTSRVDLVEAVCKHFAIAFENARLYSIAITDELTGLFTVRHFRTSLDRQMDSLNQYGERFVLLIIDIDDFKKVNDEYGHVFGDEVLKHVARCIADSVRSNDLVFRYGGEEFTVILPSTGRPGGLHVAERIRAAVEEYRIELPNGEYMSKTVSIGMTVCPDDVCTLKELMLETDKALYSAKHSGKNRVVTLFG